MNRVIIESPYAGDIDMNLRYLRACMRDSLLRGEAPYASHGLYTQPGVLDDDDPAEREHGIRAGFAWRDASDLTAVYTDLGISRGMQYGIDHATETGHPVEYRSLGADWDSARINDLVEMARPTSALGVAVPSDTFIRNAITKGLTP